MQVGKTLFTEIQVIIPASQEAAVRSVDHRRVRLYRATGQKIFEEERGAKARADYGTYRLKYLAEKLEPLYGSGFSRRQLERQINSQLFERLLLSKDVQSVPAVARAEKQPSEAKDIVKDPIVPEFPGLKREAAYYERDLEGALITHPQEFLPEQGNGFSFVARQKRLNIDGDEFFIDPVFYNRPLQCFVIIEIIATGLTREGLGRLQMYVNYYDRFERQAFANRTIRILLCADKNDAAVRISLPEDKATIVAGRYRLYLPGEKQLMEEIKKEMENVKQKQAHPDADVPSLTGTVKRKAKNGPRKTKGTTGKRQTQNTKRK